MIGVISCPIRSLEIAGPEQVEWFNDYLRPSISPSKCRHLFLCLSHEYKRATVLTVITVGSQMGKEKKNENVFSLRSTVFLFWKGTFPRRPFHMPDSNWVTWLLLQKDGQENWVVIFPDTKSKMGDKNAWKWMLNGFIYWT